MRSIFELVVTYMVSCCDSALHVLQCTCHIITCCIATSRVYCTCVISSRAVLQHHVCIARVISPRAVLQHHVYIARVSYRHVLHYRIYGSHKLLSIFSICKKEFKYELNIDFNDKLLNYSIQHNGKEA